jgi:exosortase A
MRGDGIAVAAERSPPALPWIMLAAAVLAVVAVYWETFASLVAIWRDSETFAHCFLVPPIVLYLVWRKRAALAAVPMRVNWAGIALVLVLTLGWFVASAAEVQFGQQLTVVLMIPALTLAILGIEATKVILFPLAYLVFAVPFGEALIPTLMDITASITVFALRLTGLPVLREGMLFSIPSGDFEVAKACSGIRYLIACGSLGLLFAHFSYRSWRKRAVFIAASIIAAIVANGIRAYLIVMIAHLSGMRLAVGIDHLIYGWLFFGLLVALMFWVGGRYADATPVAVSGPVLATATATATATASASRGTSPALTCAFALGAVAVAAAGPLLLGDSRAAGGARPASLPLLRQGDWSGPRAAELAWFRDPGDARVARGGAYGEAGQGVDLLIVSYPQSTRGVEMVGSVGALIDRDRWHVAATAQADLTGAAIDLQAREVVLRSGERRRVLWYWYAVGEARTSADWRAKLLEAWDVIVRGGSDSRLVIVSAETGEPGAARTVLRRFAQAALPAIAACLERGAPDCAAVP